MTLGWAGLLPFLSLPFGLVFCATKAQIWIESVSAYGLAIVSFLAGAWWGIALLRREKRILLLSNAIVLIAWAGFLTLDTQVNFALLAMLLLGSVVIERTHPLFSRQPAYYATLRLRLGAIASLSLLVSAAVSSV